MRRSFGVRSASPSLAFLVAAPLAARAWEAGTRFRLEREARIRMDFINELGSDIVGWRPGGALEVARRFGSGTAVSIGYALAAYTPVSIVPGGWCSPV